MGDQENRSKDTDFLFHAVKPVPYEEYKDMLKDWFILDRDEDGILTVQMCINGGPAVWCYGIHKGLGLLCKFVSQDLDNQVMIITGTGDQWLGYPDFKYLSLLNTNSVSDPQKYAQQTYDEWYKDGVAELKNFIFDLEIPTIAAINGPSPVGHTEFALACDLTLMTPDASFFEKHYATANLVTGDGQYLALHHLLGDKRMNYLVYTGEEINAERALEWGLVNEVVPREHLLERAKELAHKILAADYHVRRLQHRLMTESWRKDLENNFDYQFALEGWGATMTGPAKGNAATAKEMDKFKKQKEAKQSE